MSDKMAFRPLRPAIATKRAGCRAAPVLPPGVVRVPAPPTRPSLPVSPKRPSSARIASRPAACHAASLIKAYARRDPPLHRRKALPILSELFQRPEASARKKLRPSSLPGIPGPNRSSPSWKKRKRTSTLARWSTMPPKIPRSKPFRKERTQKCTLKSRNVTRL